MRGPRTSYNTYLLHLQLWAVIAYPCKLPAAYSNYTFQPAHQAGPDVDCLWDSPRLAPTLATVPASVCLVPGTSHGLSLLKLQSQQD